MKTFYGKNGYLFSYHFNRLFGRITYFKKQLNVNFTDTGERKSWFELHLK